MRLLFQTFQNVYTIYSHHFCFAWVYMVSVDLWLIEQKIPNVNMEGAALEFNAFLWV